MKKYDVVMMKTAKVFAEESYCKKLKVGAVLAKEGRILITGYNGTIAGMDNICEKYNYRCPYCKAIVDDLIDDESTTCGCGHTIGSWFIHGAGKPKVYITTLPKIPLDKTNDFTLHAEQNVITYAAKEGISTKGTTMYITHSPCKQCAKLIAQSGVSRVVFEKDYKDLSGVKFLEQVGVEVRQLEEIV